jgi:hypothetical protein
MKQKQVPSGTRPAMFYQEAAIKFGSPLLKPDALIADRIRIVYPNGKIEWLSFEVFNKDGYYAWGKEPCYIGDRECYGVKNKPRTFKQAMDLIAIYDKGYEWEPMEFLGEL